MPLCLTIKIDVIQRVTLLIFLPTRSVYSSKAFRQTPSGFPPCLNGLYSDFTSQGKQPGPRAGHRSQRAWMALNVLKSSPHV
jgi:hypothetical protein